jgi:hypothetical protein
MRAFAFALALIVVLGAAYLAYAVGALTQRRRVRRIARRDAAARWHLRHFGEGACTVVAVSLFAPGGPVLDQHVVARIPTDDPEWTTRFLEAKEIAEERAFHLNASLIERPDDSA